MGSPIWHLSRLWSTSRKRARNCQTWKNLWTIIFMSTRMNDCSLRSANSLVKSCLMSISGNIGRLCSNQILRLRFYLLTSICLTSILTRTCFQITSTRRRAVLNFLKWRLLIILMRRPPLLSSCHQPEIMNWCIMWRQSTELKVSNVSLLKKGRFSHPGLKTMRGP